MTAKDTGADYWSEVERILRVEHRAKKAEATEAVKLFRNHVAPAGQTIFNSDPADVAATVIGHGLIPSLPAVGLHLQLAFTLADPETVLANPLVELATEPDTDPHLMGEAVVKLWEVANEYHMAKGGGVLTLDEFKQFMPALVPVGPSAGS